MLDAADLQAYAELISEEEDAALVGEFQREWGPGRAPGHRDLALVDDVPMGKGYVSFAGPPGVAAIYGMSVKPEARGRGIAGGLTTILLRRAKEAGSRRAVLHSTEMAVGIYRRSGFVERCRFTAFATAQLWSHGG